jgi:hypothetical protein
VSDTGPVPEQPLVFHFYPESEPDPEPAGVTPAWLVLWDGKPGPAHIIKGAMLHEGDGGLMPVFDGEMEPCTVIDDSPE